MLNTFNYFTIFAKIFSQRFAGDIPGAREHESTVEQRNTFEQKYSDNQNPNLWWFKPCSIEFQMISWLNLIIFFTFFAAFLRSKKKISIFFSFSETKKEIYFYPKPFILFFSTLSSPCFCDFRIRTFHFRFIGFVLLYIGLWHPTPGMNFIVRS